jgi:hypothetical protein
MQEKRSLIPIVIIAAVALFLSFAIDWRAGAVVFGGLVVGLGLTAVVIIIARYGKQTRVNQRTVPKMTVVSGAYEVDPTIQPQTARTVRIPMNTRPEDRPLANILIANLRIAGIDVNRPVFYGANNREISIREMVTEISSVSQSRGMDRNKMIEKISTIYEYLWVYVDEICTKHGADGDAAIKTALANKCLDASFLEQANK